MDQGGLSSLPEDGMEGGAMSRAKAIRKHYLWLCLGSAYEVKLCPMTTHPLYPYRFGKLPEGKTPTDRAKAIRECCLECCGGEAPSVRKCKFIDCDLWGYRFGYGKNLSIGGTGGQTKAQAGSCMPEESKALIRAYTTLKQDEGKA